MTFYRNHTLNSPSTEMSHLISLYSSSGCSGMLSALSVWKKVQFEGNHTTVYKGQKIYVFKTILQITYHKSMSLYLIFLHLFQMLYNTVISDTYVPP